MFKTLSTVAAALLLSSAAHAGTVVVNAIDPNGSDAGFFTAGESFSVTVAADDLWSAGGLPRFSNADGLTGNLYATAGDDSGGITPGTLIGQDWGYYGGFHYGELVGQIGSGPVFAVGTDFYGTANATGELKLFYWDSTYGDNFGSITATVAVPEPANIALVGLALGAFALARRRKA